MRIDIASRHNPRPEGSPTGRVFWALGEGLVALGHDVRAMAWAHEQPHDDLPSWCEWRAIPPEPWVRTKARAVLRPRQDVALTGWRPRPDSIAIAEDPISFPVVARHRDAAVVFHYLTKLDAPRLRRPTPRDVQDLRNERRVAKKAPLVLAFSERVAGGVGHRARTVPIAYPVPPERLPLADQPVVLLLANWAWPPNEPALRHLLSVWPEVRSRVPGATLRLAGWGLESMGVRATDGVERLGAVPRVVDALDGAAVLAFPCPATSGPKVKVMEALSYGVPVVTTPAGAEGLVLGPEGGALVTDRSRFADALVGVLGDDARRARLADAGRSAMVEHHAPLPAARARVAMLEEVFGGS